MIQALGGSVVAVFPAGGPAGDLLRTLLDDAGVATAPVSVTAVTRESFTVDDRASGEQYRFVLPGATLSEDEVDRLLEAVAALPQPPSHVVASGSLPPGMDADIFKRLCGLCGTIGAKLIVDTSGPALAALEGSCTYLIKPSLRELEDLAGRPLQDADARQDAARDLIARGFAEVVVVSLGEDGAMLITGDAAISMPAITVPDGSAVGAGDSMVAALVLALARDLSLEEALRWGVAAGAAALIAPARELTRRNDVERLYSAAWAVSAGISTQNSA